MICHEVHSKMAVTHLPAPLLYKCQRKLLSCEDELGLRRSSVVMLGLANGIWLQVSNWLLGAYHNAPLPQKEKEPSSDPLSSILLP